ncbi:MAG: hypothetical protein R6W95_08435 [Desulfosarcina sp.]
MKNFFSSRWGIISVGAIIGILAALLQKLGNPGNMGICVACFERDIAGDLAAPTPASQVIELIHQLPRAIERVLKAGR